MWRNTGVVVVCATLVLFGRTYAAETMQCPDGKPAHLATPGEAASAPSKGIIAGVTNICTGDTQLGITGDVGVAKKYLKSLPRTGSATNDTNIEKLNGSFAICAANFLKEFQKRYGAVTISSAYRSPEYDAKMCRNNPSCGALMNNPNPNGNHQKGLAMDVRASAGQETMSVFARQNPQFGVCLPFTNGSSFKDTVHLILAGIPSNETRGPGCAGVTKACSGSNFNPKDVQQPRPTSPVADALRNIINPPRPPASSEYFCVTSRDPVIVIPLNTPPGPECLNYQGRLQQQSATPSVYTPSQQGTPGIQNPTQQGTPNQQGSPPLQDSMPVGYKTGPLAGTTTASTTNPTLEQLLLNIGQGSTTSSGTSTVVIVSSGSLRTLGSEAVTIAPPLPPSQSGTVPTTITPMTDGGIPAAPQTFAPSSTYTGMNERAGFSETLADIQSALQRILTFLQPFRGRIFNGIENAE